MRRTKTIVEKDVEVSEMELIQIGTPQSKPAMSIREMFEEMASREAEMIRAARQKLSAASTGRKGKR